MLFQPFLYLFAFLGISPFSSLRKWRSADFIPDYNVAMSSSAIWASPCQQPQWLVQDMMQNACMRVSTGALQGAIGQEVFSFPLSCQLVTCMLDAVSSHRPPREYLMTSKRKIGNRVERDYKEKRENLSANDFSMEGIHRSAETYFTCHTCLQLLS